MSKKNTISNKRKTSNTANRRKRNVAKLHPESQKTDSCQISIDFLLQQWQIIRDKNKNIQEILTEQQKEATIVFFDLVNSSAFRQNYGANEALMKAKTHNIIVSHEIMENGGKVVKWLGDGVMGVFSNDGHIWAGLRAALSAIKSLKKHNKDYYKKKSDSYKHMLTRVGISSGPVQYLSVQAEEEGIVLTSDDPMGDCVDLAARLQSFAETSVILLDKETYKSICADNIEEISYHKLKRAPEKTTA